ncbi:hypothetical protein MMC07_003040 [Pseudocyphellaria aurata]|nr:hypothetical protein [Pseudocyphellaria aurata]
MKFFKKASYSQLPSSESESISTKNDASLEDFSHVNTKDSRRFFSLSNPFTPALEAVTYKATTLQNKFNESSIYRGPPTLEREKAWLDLWDHAAISIPESKLPLLNKSSSAQSFRHLPSSLGGGISGLPDVFHQLHCLDTIRQYTWFLAGNYGSAPTTVTGDPKQHPLLPIPPVFDGTSDVANRMHADHCIETLRKTLMCHADVTPLLILRDDSNPIGDRPDFNLHQKCRDWDAIREWTTRNWVTGRGG